MSKTAEKMEETIVWEREEKEKTEPRVDADNVIQFPQRNTEVTHQKILVHPDAKPVKVVSSGFGNIRGQIKCAA